MYNSIGVQMFVTIVGMNFATLNSFLQGRLKAYLYFIIVMLYFSLLIVFLLSIQVIKGISAAVLIWGAAKKNHFFYQPWLFINGLENALLTLLSIIGFVISPLDSFRGILVLAIPCAIIAVHGWYIWSCIFRVYRRDMNPNTVIFSTNYANFNNIDIDI